MRLQLATTLGAVHGPVGARTKENACDEYIKKTKYSVLAGRMSSEALSSASKRGRIEAEDTAAATGTPSKVAKDIRADLQDAADVVAARNASILGNAGLPEQGQVDVAVECRNEAASKGLAAQKKPGNELKRLQGKLKIPSSVSGRSRRRSAAARGEEVAGSCNSQPTDGNEDVQPGADQADGSATAPKQASPPCAPPPSPSALPPPPPPPPAPALGPPKISATSLQPATDERADPPAAKPSSKPSPPPRSPLPPPPDTSSARKSQAGPATPAPAGRSKGGRTAQARTAGRTPAKPTTAAPRAAGGEQGARPRTPSKAPRTAAAAAGTPAAGTSRSAASGGASKKGGKGGGGAPQRVRGLQKANQQPPRDPGHGQGQTAKFIRRRDVPHELILQFSHAAADALERVVSDASMAGGSSARDQVVSSVHKLLHDCPQTLAEPRGGSDMKKRNKYIEVQIQRFREGIVAEEPGEDTASAMHRRRQQSEDARIGGGVMRGAKSGNVGQGARQLENGQLADPTDPAVMEQARSLHPSAAPPAALECDILALQIDSVTFYAVIDRIRTHSKGKAGGPSCWTFEMVIAVVTGSSRGFDAALAFVNLILSGLLPRECGLLDSTLILLKKQNGGVRPIAIGEVWYRVAALCALEAVGREVGRSLAPLQVGVGTRGGAEAVGHSVRAALEADEESMVVTLDARNAFNEIHRSVIFEAVKQRCPALLPLVQFSYGGPTPLFVRGAAPGTVIESQRGVRQGDPLGPFLFALGFHTVLEKAAAAVPEAAPVAYLDDLNVVARGPAQRKFLGRLQGPESEPDSLAAIGLTAVPRKSAAYTPHERAQAECNAVSRATGIPRREDGVVLVGTPIGSEKFVKETVGAKAQSTLSLLDKLMGLASVTKQVKYQVCRMSLSARLRHFQRTLPWALIEEATGALDRGIINAVASMLSIEQIAGPTCFSDLPQSLQQLALPFRHGGFGLRLTSGTEAEAAFFSGVGAAHQVMRGGPTAFQTLDGAPAEALQRRWEALRAACPAIPEKLDRDKTDSLASTATRTNLSFVQNIVARAEADAAGAAMLRVEQRTNKDGVLFTPPPSEERKRDIARIRSASGAAASGFLLALPVTQRTTLGDLTFTTACRHRLGERAYASIDTPPCVCSGGNIGKPDHPVICRNLAHDMQLRHDYIRDTARQFIKCASCPSSDEPPFRKVGDGSGMEGGHRADILAILPGGRAVMVDVTVVHPLGQERLKSAWRKAGEAAVWAETNKRTRWEEFVDKPQYEFVPFAMETYGRLGPKATAFVKEIAEIAVSSGRVSKSRFMMNAYMMLSCALQKWNCAMYAKAQVAVARAAGKRFMPGLDVSVEPE